MKKEAPKKEEKSETAEKAKDDANAVKEKMKAAAPPTNPEKLKAEKEMAEKAMTAMKAAKEGSKGFESQSMEKK